MWILGFLAVWTSIEVVFVAARDWRIVAILAVPVVLTVAMWWVAFRAKRRVPETKRRLDELSG